MADLSAHLVRQGQLRVEVAAWRGAADTRAHYRVGRGIIETPAAHATVQAQGGHARGARVPEARRGVACIPDDRQGRRLADSPAGGTLASGTGGQLFRDERGRGAGDLAQDGYCLVSSMIASPEHSCLGGVAVVRNGGTGAGPPGALPLGPARRSRSRRAAWRQVPEQ